MFDFDSKRRGLIVGGETVETLKEIINVIIRSYEMIQDVSSATHCNGLISVFF